MNALLLLATDLNLESGKTGRLKEGPSANDSLEESTEDVVMIHTRENAAEAEVTEEGDHHHIGANGESLHPQSGMQLTKLGVVLREAVAVNMTTRKLSRVKCMHGLMTRDNHLDLLLIH